MKSAVVEPTYHDGVEEHATHRHWGHLTQDEAQEYGLIPGETLDEEGRVIPPWIARGERYGGPKAEDEVRYPYDYGYGPRGYLEASRGKVPPPQLHLKDKSAAPRRDPDLYSDVAPYMPYGVRPQAGAYPIGVDPNAPLAATMPMLAGSATPYGQAYGYGPAYGYGYGYGYGHPLGAPPL